MSTSDLPPATFRAVRFHKHGEPADVLKMDVIALPEPGPGSIRVAVHACGLNPADWALCRGLFAGMLPRGVGLDVSGVVDAIGEGVTDVAVGDAVFGVPDYAGFTSAGLADQTILKAWAPIPAGLDKIEASSLPMIVETAFRSLESLGVQDGQSLVVHGGGTMVGFAAVQMARMRGARVIATAGDTFAKRLEALGAAVTPYGSGMVARVRALAGGTPDLVLDTSPPGRGVLPDLVRIAGGDPKRVLTITDFAAAKELGVRNSIDEGDGLRYEALAPFAKLAAEKKFTVPVARIFSFEDWREAMEISLAGEAKGKLIVLCGKGW